MGFSINNRNRVLKLEDNERADPSNESQTNYTNLT